MLELRSQLLRMHYVCPRLVSGNNLIKGNQIKSGYSSELRFELLRMFYVRPRLVAGRPINLTKKEPDHIWLFLRTQIWSYSECTMYTPDWSKVGLLIWTKGSQIISGHSSELRYELLRMHYVCFRLVSGMPINLSKGEPDHIWLFRRTQI